MKKYIIIGLILAAGIALPLLGRAAYSQASIVSSNEVVPDNFVSFADTTTIDGKVEGDVIAAGSQVTINGEVTGDVIVVAYSLTISGRVGGSVRAAVSDITIRGPVGRNATVAAANQLTVTNIGSIDGSLAYAAGTVAIAGPIAGNITGQAMALELNSEIKKDVQVGVNRGALTLGPQAKVGGNLRYEASEDIVLNKDAVTGTITRRDPLVDITRFRQLTVKLSWIFRITNFLGLWLVGLIIVLVFPKGAQAIVHDMSTSPFAKIGWGVLFLIGFPIAMVVLASSLIGLPVAGILAALYGLGLYISTTFISLLIGHSFFSYVLRGKNMPGALSLAVGLLAFTALTWLPYLGTIIGLAGITWGFSGLVRALVRHIRRTNSLSELK